MNYAYVNAKILDGKLNEAGEMPAFSGAVLVKDGKIEAVISEEDRNSKNLTGYEVVDLGGKFLLPGLVNMHVHLASAGGPAKTKKKPVDYKKLFDTLTKYKLVLTVFKKMNANNAKTQLYSGVTTIRTMGGMLDFDGQIRDDIKAGKMDGPRIIAANTAISVPDGHFAGSLATISETPAQAVEDLKKIIATKPDVIKLMITGGVMDASEPGALRMQPEIVKAVCDEAHRQGFKVAAHVESTEGIRVALKNGVDTVEHSSAYDEEIVALFKETGAINTCTLAPALPGVYAPADSPYNSEIGRANCTQVFGGIVEGAKAALENGIPVGLGTDAGCGFSSHYDTWREMFYATKFLGLTNAQALNIMTEKNAFYLGLGALTGTVEAGKSADLIVVDNDPTKDLNTFRNVRMVSMEGKLIKNPKVKKFKVSEELLDLLMTKI